MMTMMKIRSIMMMMVMIMNKISIIIRKNNQKIISLKKTILNLKIKNNYLRKAF